MTMTSKFKDQLLAWQFCFVTNSPIHCKNGTIYPMKMLLFF